MKPSPAKAALIRLAREAVALAIPVLLWHLNNDPKWLALKPVLTALAKFLREQYGWSWLPI